MADIQRQCRVTGQSFIIPEAEQVLLRRLSEDVRLQLPLPTVHPLEMLRQLCAFGSYFFLHRGTSGITGKPQLTRYHPGIHPKLCTVDEFWSDRVDNTERGQDYDFTRPFFEQFREVLDDSFLLPYVQINAEGCEYVNGVLNVKDCYLCFITVESQNCLYCFTHYNGHDNLECVGAHRSQYCYSCLNINDCYECQNCEDCSNCHQCIGCVDCIGCGECFGAAGLRNVSYCWRGEPLTAAQYRARLAALNLGDRCVRNSQLELCRQYAQQVGARASRFVACENSSGNYLKHCKNAYQCFSSHDLEDCGYALNSMSARDCWRCFSVSGQFSYQAVPIRATKTVNSYACSGGEEHFYSLGLEQNCSCCFGCAGLKRKSYCILNKQYTKEAYFDLLPRIAAQMRANGEWGEYFPPGLAPYLYEQSLSTVFFDPLDNGELQRRGYRFDSFAEQPPPANLSDAAALPPDIREVKDEQVLGQALRCKLTGNAFNIQRAELDFYRRFSLPLPDEHWRERIYSLWRKRELVPAVAARQQ